MNYILDSDVIITHMRGYHPITPQVYLGNVCMSIITYGELVVGANKSLHKEKELNFINSLINDFDIEIFSININVIDKYAEIRTSLDKSGQPLKDFDILIAATAIVNDCTLITYNKKHFNRISSLKIL